MCIFDARSWETSGFAVQNSASVGYGIMPASHARGPGFESLDGPSMLWLRGVCKMYSLGWRTTAP